MHNIIKRPGSALEEAIQLAPQLRQLRDAISRRIFERDKMVETILIGMVTGFPTFYLGVPGTAKTHTIQTVVHHIRGASMFDALMPAVPDPGELFVESTEIHEQTPESGEKVINIRKKLGRAADATCFFADEIWKGYEALLNTLLDFANGGFVRHEGELVKTPLMGFLPPQTSCPIRKVIWRPCGPA